MSEFSFAVSASIAASANKAGSNGRASAMAFSPLLGALRYRMMNRRRPAVF
jgi:hypothetical protein